MTSETRTVLTACADGIATLTLNRPEARNALDMTMRRELEESLARLAGDPQVRVLVVRGAGAGTFGCRLDPDPAAPARITDAMQKFAKATRADRIKAVQEATGPQNGAVTCGSIALTEATSVGQMPLSGVRS